MRVLLIGDIHLYDLAVAPWHLAGKRLLGQMNLWMHRRKVFDPALFPPVLKHALSLEPDWILFSGDLTTTSLESELAMVRHALGPMMQRGQVVIVPGNHDRYTYAATRRKRFESHFAPAAPKDYPHVVDLTPQWRLLALDSSCPRMFTSQGRIGRSQLNAIVRVLDDTPLDRGVMVLCHYPFAQPPGRVDRWTHRLADRQELEDILRHGNRRVVFMHGHIHRPWHWQPTDKLQVINAGSPCMVSAHYPAGQGFWQMELREDPALGIELVRHTPIGRIKPDQAAPQPRRSRKMPLSDLQLNWSQAQPITLR